MKDRQADIIKISAVLTAIPRWTGALLEAEGVPIPPEWLGWWRILSAVLSVGMAVTEAFAVSYVLNAWRNQHDKNSWRLIALAICALCVFTVVLAPYVAANVRGMRLPDVLGSGWLWWAWSVSVAASTGVVVGATGYAQKVRIAPAQTQHGAIAPQPAQLQAQQFNDDAFREFALANPSMTGAQVAQAFGVAPSTITRAAQRVGLHRNGNGWEAIAAQ
jgi:hypothetical protein